MLLGKRYQQLVAGLERRLDDVLDRVSVLLRRLLLLLLLLLEQISGRRLIVEIFGLVDHDVSGREALRVDRVVGLEPEQQRLID